MAEQNNNSENSDSLRSGAASSAGKRTFSMCVYFKLRKRPISVMKAAMNLN